MVEPVQREIVLPETKPETEWLGGRAVQKAGANRRQGELELWFGERMLRWARGKGCVGSQWRFRVGPPGEVIRPLVPDLSFLSYERMAGKSDDDWDAPLTSPDVAVEIRSPGDRFADLAEKIAVLLRAGTHLIIVVDTRARRVALHDGAGRRAIEAPGVLEHAALPGFAVDVSEMFDALELDGPSKP